MSLLEVKLFEPHAYECKPLLPQILASLCHFMLGA
jgi:hypothetical protein